MQKFLSLLILTFAGINTQAQKVAIYSFGKYGNDDYECFDFWIKENKKAAVEYTYGKKQKDIKLKFLGKDTLNGERCFKVEFSNKYVLYIIPNGLKLKVSDASGKYLKIFSWKYEGPVNGIGTFCSVCAEDENEAMTIIQQYFMQ